MEGLWALPVASLAAGDSHSAALTMNGFLFSWGANDKGQLGLPKNAEAAAQVCTPHISICRPLVHAFIFIWCTLCQPCLSVGRLAHSQLMSGGEPGVLAGRCRGRIASGNEQGG